MENREFILLIVLIIFLALCEANAYDVSIIDSRADRSISYIEIVDDCKNRHILKIKTKDINVQNADKMLTKLFKSGKYNKCVDNVK